MAFVPDDTATIDAPAPAAGRFVPDEPAAPAAPRAGAAAIPTEAEAAGKPYTPPAAPLAPKPVYGITDRIKGAVEAGVNTATGVIGALLGGVTGAGQAVAESTGLMAPSQNLNERTNLATGEKTSIGPAKMAPISLEQAMGQHAEGITGALKRTFTGPADLRAEQTPDSELGQQYTEALAPAMETMLAGAPLHGTMGPKGALEPVKQAAGDIRRGYVAPAARGAADAAGAQIGKAARKVLPVDPELAKVAQIASEQKYPIDVRPDQVIEGAKFSKLAGQAASDTPLAGSARESNQVAFTRNLIDMLDPTEAKADRLTPEVFDKAMRRSGEGIGDIMAKTDVPVDSVREGVEGLRKNAEKFATDNDKRIISNYIDELISKAGDDGVINGTALKELNSEIGARARTEAGNDLGRRLNDLQDIIHDAVEKHVEPGDATPLREYRRQYAYGKIVEPLVAKTIDGKVSPAGLMARVTATKQGKQFMARSAGGPIGDLAKVGQLIKEPGSSGTAERSLVYGAIKDTAKTAAGIAGGYPLAAAYNVLGPKLTRAMVGKRAKKAAPKAPEPPPEPTTSPGAGPGTPPPAGKPPGPLGDLTPDWETTPGAGGGRPRGGSEPGLVPAVGEKPITRFVPDRKAETPSKRAGSEIPAVPGRPDLPDTLRSGAPKETAATERANRALDEPGTQEALRRQRASVENSAENIQSVRDALDTGKTLGYSFEGDGTVKAGAGLDAAKKITLDLNESEKKALKRAQALGELAETTEERREAREAERTALAPAVERATREKIPVGEATEVSPEEHAAADKKWRTDHKLGEEDAGRARDVASALDHDADAVHAAVRQHENNPRAFDREIARINEEGQARENESKQAARSGASDAGTPVRQAEAQPEPAATIRGAAEQPGPDRTPATGTGREGVEPAGRPGQVARDAARANGVEIVEVPGGFEARRDGKKVGYLKDNLERGQAELLGENANVDMVKVDKDQAGAGTGRALYEAFNEKHGGRILPSGKTEPSAWNLWKRNYPEKVDQFVKDEAARIRDGADPGLVARNITDAEVRSRVLKESERGPDPQPDNQPGAVRKEAGQEGLQDDGGSLDKAVEEGQEPAENGVGAAEAGGGSLDKAATARKTIGTAGAMDKMLRERFGDKLIQGLKDQGILKYEAENLERPWSAATFNSGIDPGTKPHATLYYGKLTPEEVPKALMHELGEHFGMVRLLGQERYNVMLNELKALKNTDEVKASWAHVKKFYTDRDARIKEGGTVFLREVAAHLVESHPNLPFVRRIVNEIRAFFYENFGTTMGTRVDADLIRGLAASALRKASKGQLPRMQASMRVTPLVAPRPATNLSAPRRFVQ